MKPSEKAALAINVLDNHQWNKRHLAQLADIIARETGCDEMRELLQKLIPATHQYVGFSTNKNYEILDGILDEATALLSRLKPETMAKCKHPRRQRDMILGGGYCPDCHRHFKTK